MKLIVDGNVELMAQIVDVLMRNNVVPDIQVQEPDASLQARFDKLLDAAREVCNDWKGPGLTVHSGYIKTLAQVVLEVSGEN